MTTPTDAPWTDGRHTHHATISDAAACPECRAWNINFLRDAPHAFVLTFPPDDDAPQALSVVRSWSPITSDASEVGWATGCNLPRGVLIMEIPMSVAVESGVEMFRLHEGADADDALREIEALGS